MPSPADAGHKEHAIGKLLAVECEAFPRYAMPDELTSLQCGGGQLAVDFDVGAVAPETLARGVDGKMGDGANLAEGVEVEVSVLRRNAPDVSECR